MDVHPVLASLRKHKIPVVLIVLEIALACAVFCNAVFIIGQRLAELGMPNAIDESGLVDIGINGTDPRLASAGIPETLDALRRIPGAKGAAAMTAVPFGKSYGVDSVSAKPDSQNSPGASRYMFTRGAPGVLGLKLLRGRFFTAGEYAASSLGGKMTPNGHVVIVTQALSERLWPGQQALGKQLWIGAGHHYTVVGIVANVARPGSGTIGQSYDYYATLFPLRPDPALTQYMVRSAPRDRQRVLRAALAKLQAMAPSAVIKGRTFARIREKAFSGTYSMVWILALVCAVMLAVTAFGIVGLTSFWVRQRRLQIGIRRAMGATRANILHYFQTENFLIVTFGIVLGAVLALALNLQLMQQYGMPRLPFHYLPAGAVALWLLGQLAVLAPALRASNVPPVVATRTA